MANYTLFQTLFDRGYLGFEFKYVRVNVPENLMVRLILAVILFQFIMNLSVFESRSIKSRRFIAAV